MGTRWRILARRWSIVSPSVSTLVWMRVNYGDVTTMADTNLHVKSRGAPVFAPPTTNPFSYAAIVPDLSVFRTKYVKRSSPATPAHVSGVVSSASAVARVENSARLLAVGMIKKRERKREREKEREIERGRGRNREERMHRILHFYYDVFRQLFRRVSWFPSSFPQIFGILHARAVWRTIWLTLCRDISAIIRNSRMNIVELFWKNDG